MQMNLNVVVIVFVVNILGMFFKKIILNGIEINIQYQPIITHMDISHNLMLIIFDVILKHNQKFLHN